MKVSLPNLPCGLPNIRTRTSRNSLAGEAGGAWYELASCRVQVFRRADLLPRAWEEVGPADLFLQRSYLAALEEAPPEGMTFVYWLFYRHDKPIGLAYGQILEFDAAHHIQALAAQPLKKHLASLLRFRLLVCGNLLLSGQHAYHFLPQVPDGPDLLSQALSRWAASAEIPGMVIKDLPVDPAASEAPFPSDTYIRAEFQPNMVLRIRPSWKGMPDYLADLSSKYRVRARRAFRKARGITRRVLEASEIAGLKDRLFELYRKVAEEAKVNMVGLQPEYLPALAAALPDRFQMVGYWQGETLIGYRTTLDNGAELEAHFLGLQRELNPTHDLYLNMLYDIIEEGIQGGFERIVFSRTALEIKSSVGAAPEPLALFINSRLAWFKPLIPHLIEWLEPAAAWRQRHPFRKGPLITGADSG